jgi:hypothetical protein
LEIISIIKQNKGIFLNINSDSMNIEDTVETSPSSCPHR